MTTWTHSWAFESSPTRGCITSGSTETRTTRLEQAQGERKKQKGKRRKGSFAEAQDQLESIEATQQHAREQGCPNRIADNTKSRQRFDNEARRRRHVKTLKTNRRPIPEEAREAFRRGFVLQREGKGEQALECYRTGLALCPWFGNGWLYLGELLWEQHEFDLAVDAMHKAVELRPRDEICSLGLFHDRGAHGTVATRHRGASECGVRAPR